MKGFIGKQKTRIEFKLTSIGKDFYLKIWNKKKAHIGAIILCEKQKIKLIKIKNHKEYLVFKPIAKKLSEKLNAKILVFGGIHIENPTKKELKKLIQNIKKIPEKIIKNI